MDSRLNYYLSIEISYKVDENECKNMITKIYKDMCRKGANVSENYDLFKFLDIINYSNFVPQIINSSISDGIEIRLMYPLEDNGGHICCFDNEGKFIRSKTYHEYGVPITINSEEILDISDNQADIIELTEYLGTEWYLMLDKNEGYYEIVFNCNDCNKSEYCDIDINKVTNFYKENIY